MQKTTFSKCNKYMDNRLKDQTNPSFEGRVKEA